MIHQIIADFPMIFPLLVRFFVPFFSHQYPSSHKIFPIISPLKGNTKKTVHVPTFFPMFDVVEHIVAISPWIPHLHLQTRPAGLRGLEEVAPSWTWMTSSGAHEELFFVELHRWNCENQQVNSTWWLIPLSKWVITPVINGISRVNPLITGVITHLLSGMSHPVWLTIVYL